MSKRNLAIASVIISAGLFAIIARETGHAQGASARSIVEGAAKALGGIEKIRAVRPDIALSCDLVVMADDARIGYMPSRVWGCPTTAMWVYRLGAERAKRMLLTGDTIDGATAADWGLVVESVPAPDLHEILHRAHRKLRRVRVRLHRARALPLRRLGQVVRGRLRAHEVRNPVRRRGEPADPFDAHRAPHLVAQRGLGREQVRGAGGVMVVAARHARSLSDAPAAAIR